MLRNKLNMNVMPAVECILNIKNPQPILTVIIQATSNKILIQGSRLQRIYHHRNH